jgi:glutathione S-transferase
MIRLYRFKYSTNVERVALALAHKKLPTDSVWVDPDDRAPVRAVSGQDLVPTIVDLDHGQKVVVDSMVIVKYLEAAYPERALFPADPARRAEMDIFIEWFDRVWKRPPNLIYDELSTPDPDRVKIAAWGAEMAGWLPGFEALLTGRDYLLGAEFSAADVCAFPFLRYALTCEADDTHLFHDILVEHMSLNGNFPRLAAWIRRIDTRPRA